MKVDKISFSYRGTDRSAGNLLTRLLEDITVQFEYGSGPNARTVFGDLGALLRVLDEYARPRTPEPPKTPKYAIGWGGGLTGANMAVCFDLKYGEVHIEQPRFLVIRKGRQMIAVIPNVEDGSGKERAEAMVAALNKLDV